jgi:response regulator NasT
MTATTIPDSPRPPSDSRNGGSPPGDDAKPRLLIADDDRLVLTTLAEGLSLAGYEVVTAASGAEALESAAAGTFDLAILDLRMPGMEGIELARRLHDYTRIPFLILSAYGDAGLVEQAVNLGALGYLVKPLDVPQIVPAVQAAVMRGREIRKLRDTESQLSSALNVEQRTRMAVGLLMEREHLDRKAAFDLLRSQARSQRRKLAEVAEELLSAAEKLNEFSPRHPTD